MFMAGCTRYNIIYAIKFVSGRWFSPCTLVSSINKTDRHDITKILLKVALSTIKQTNINRGCQIKTMGSSRAHPLEYNAIISLCKSLQASGMLILCIIFKIVRTVCFVCCNITYALPKIICYFPRYIIFVGYQF